MKRIIFRRKKQRFTKHLFTKNLLMEHLFIRHLYIACFGILFMLPGCQKKHESLSPPNDNIFVNSVFNYLNQHLAPTEINNLSINHYTILTHSNDNRFLWMRYRNSDRQLLAEKMPEGLRGNIVEFNYTDAEKKSRILVTEDMITKQGHRISFVNGQVIRTDPTTNGQINRYALNNSIIDQSSINQSYPDQSATTVANGVTPRVAIFPAKTEDVVVVYISMGGGSGGSNAVQLSSMYYMTNFNPDYLYAYTSQGLTSPPGGGYGTASAPKISTTVDIPMLPGGHPPKELNPVMLTPYISVMTEEQNHRYRLWLLAKEHVVFTIVEIRELEKNLAADAAR